MRAARVAFLLTSLLAVSPGAAVAQRAVAAGRIVAGVLSFDGRATVGDFTGTTTTVTGEMTGGELPAVRGWVEAPVKTLDTGNRKRDRDLNKSMESDRYPTIRFELTGVVPGAARGDTVEVMLLGTFRIHGVERADTIAGTVVLGGGRVRVRARTPLDLGNYRIGGLSKGLGMLRVQEEILVRLDLTFSASPPLDAAAR